MFQSIGKGTNASRLFSGFGHCHFRIPGVLCGENIGMYSRFCTVELKMEKNTINNVCTRAPLGRSRSVLKNFKKNFENNNTIRQGAVHKLRSH